MRSVAQALVVFVVAASGCSTAGATNGLFASTCPADGPEPEPDLAFAVNPVDVESYYDRLEAVVRGLPFRPLVRLQSGRFSLPMFHVGPAGKAGGRRLLVVAGLHGNEVAAPLAALGILADVRRQPGHYEGVELHMVVPANPVGLANQSRYDARGCDVDRDFSNFRTAEARAIRDVVEQLRPELILSLHEGRREGFTVVGSESVPERLLERVATAVGAAGISLAGRTFLGVPLGAWGTRRERWLGASGTLGAFADRRGIPALESETQWSDPDLGNRIVAHVVATREVARYLRRSAVIGKESS
ncbi:MAG: hypothetical protein ACREQ9_17315 [Candidatus Binatia bacterium]